MSSNAANSIAFLIPCFNEGKRLPESIASLMAGFVSSYGGAVDLIVVDDGSIDIVADGLASGLPLPTHVRLWVLRHEVNLGQGAALQTAITFARQKIRPAIYVSIDADGQHDPESIAGLIAPLLAGTHDIVFGTRFASRAASAMPFGRRVLLKAATIFERVITGLALSDAHNGLRAFNDRCARVIDLKQNRMAHATEFKQIVARERVRYTEAPVGVMYTAETLEKGQRSAGSLWILKDLLKAYLFNG